MSKAPRMSLPPRSKTLAAAQALARKASGGAVQGYAEGGAPDDAHMARAIQNRAMRGLDPTPEQVDYLKRVAAVREGRDLTPEQRIAAERGMADRERRSHELDGVLSGIAPAEIPMPDARIARQISARAMAGLEPTLEQSAFLREAAPGKEARSELPGTLGAIGAEITRVPSMLRTVEAARNTYQDPSIANLTDLGINAATSAFLPSKYALGIAATGAGAAGAKDTGLLDWLSSAKAADLEGLSAVQNRELEDLRATNRDYKWKNARHREEGMARIKQLEDIANEAAKTKNRLAAETANQGEADKLAAYNRAVLNAENAKAAELARDKRFSNTELGKFYDKFGILAPAIMASVPGAVSKVAHGGYKLPLAVGAGTGALAANWPLMYNAFFTEPDNPMRNAYEAYAREAPEGDPQKARALELAASLPKKNPLREQASEEFFDLPSLAKRTLVGAGEGTLAGLLGAEATTLPGKGLQFFGSIPGQVKAGYHAGEAKAAEEAAKRAAIEGPLQKGRQQLVRQGQRLREADELEAGAMPRYRGPSGASPEAGPGTALVPAGRTSLPDLAPGSASPGNPKMPSRSSEMPLPPGWARRSDGVIYNTHTGHPIPKQHYTPREAPPRRAKKSPGEDEGDPGLRNAGGAVRRALAIARRAAGGRVANVHAGPITHVADGGRTDTAPMHVASGSYVLPADTLSSLGQGDTNAGFQVAEQLFGPFATRAEGGAIPIIAAGGEAVLSPEQVARVGNGDVEQGHRILDLFVKKVRRDTIQALKRLPAPAKD
ncbi:MAG: hypothetical protein EKK41_21170 [Hyphomicrobiales bacterium]|nr:MAG: hypothetical protein EKK41_21170 [Hyphomicrobiales bacterium]